MKYNIDISFAVEIKILTNFTNIYTSQFVLHIWILDDGFSHDKNTIEYNQLYMTCFDTSLLSYSRFHCLYNKFQKLITL